MPFKGFQVKKPIEVINLISSDEEEIVPTKPARQALAPRTKVPVYITSGSPALLSTSKDDTDRRNMRSAVATDGCSRSAIRPTTSRSKLASPRAGSSMMRKETVVRAEDSDDVFTMKGLKNEVEDMFHELDTETKTTTPNAPTLTDLFADDSPPRHRDGQPSHFPSSISSSQSPRPMHQSKVEDNEHGDMSPSRASPFASQHSPTYIIPSQSTPLRSVPQPSSDTAARQLRQEKLKALVQSRQTPNRSRRAHRRASPISVDSSGSDTSGVEAEPDTELQTSEVITDGHGEDYDLERHYDTSLGSLRDFIVDDSDDSEGQLETAEIFLDTDSEEEDTEHKKRVPPHLHKDRAEGPSEEDDDERDEGIMIYTPARRTLKMPDIASLMIFESEDEADPSNRRERPIKTPKRKPRPSSPPKNRRTDPNWTKNREIIATRIFRDLDNAVFDSRLGEVKIEWNKRLTSTAGMAKSKRQPDGSRRNVVCIELSDKVLSTEEQIRDTLAHEMCHAASFIINEAMRHGHGKIFKSWGRKVMRARPDIEVTTKHNYTIEYKYQWKCETESCYVVYRRHSKSIDPARERCWACRGKLVPQFKTKSATAFQAYLKDNLKLAKSAMPGSSHGEVMRALSERWKDAPEGDHRVHWLSAGATLA